MDIETMFRRAGLPKHSGAVYEFLEQGGPQSMSAIAEGAHIHRPAAYRAVRELEAAKLVARQTVRKRTLVRARSRIHVRALFAAGERELDHVERQAPASGADLAGSGISFYEGRGSIAAVFEDMLVHTKRGETFFRYTSERDLDAVNRLLPADYRTRRDAKRLERLVISNPESGKRKRNRLERFIKFLGSERESFRQNAIELIYGNRVAFIDLNGPSALIIENATLADFQKTVFLALYRRL